MRVLGRVRVLGQLRVLGAPLAQPPVGGVDTAGSVLSGRQAAGVAADQVLQAEPAAGALAYQVRVGQLVEQLVGAAEAGVADRSHGIGRYDGMQVLVAFVWDIR